MSGVLPENTGIYGRVCYSKNGDRCLSTGEKIITDFFIDNNIRYEKEVPYKNFVKTNIRYVADWKISDGVMVEYFGFIKSSKTSKIVVSYLKKTKRKIFFCKKNNIKLIPIYPNDVNLETLEKMFKNII